jgi:1,5-anhydro-D-fructose reductase (1,5-anhydro-D-mannitol-forming)
LEVEENGMIRVGVVGGGLIGRERMEAVRKLAGRGRDVALAGVFDANRYQCEKSANDFATRPYADLDAVLADQPDWIVIAIPHDLVLPVVRTALQSRASLLLEKPMGRDLWEARQLLDVAGERLHIGFNYRYYPGIRKALQDARSGRLGRIVNVDFLLGHGCFPGQEKTWKLNPQRAGGGCLIDPGVHLLDLCLLLAPHGLSVAGGTSWSGFWKTGVEEDVSLILSADGFSITLRISIVHWRSVFRMAISGTEAYSVVNGRNRTYGPQTYTVGPRWGWQSAASQADSEQLEIESQGGDVFADEMEALFFPRSDADAAAWPGPSTAAHAFKVMDLLDRIREHLRICRHFSNDLQPDPMIVGLPKPLSPQVFSAVVTREA